MTTRKVGNFGFACILIPMLWWISLSIGHDVLDTMFQNVTVFVSVIFFIAGLIIIFNVKGFASWWTEIFEENHSADLGDTKKKK